MIDPANPENHVRPFLRKRRTSSGKVIPFVFLRTSPKQLEALIGDYVNVLASDEASLMAALGFTKPVVIEELDMATPETVGAVVRLLVSDVVVAATLSGRADAIDRGPGSIERQMSLLDPDIVPLVSAVELNKTGFNLMHFQPWNPVDSKKNDVSLRWLEMRPKRDYGFWEARENAEADLKMFRGTDEEMDSLVADLTTGLEKAKAADEERAATPLEIAKHSTMNGLRTWFREEMGIVGESLQDLIGERPAKDEFMAAMGEVASYVRSVRSHEGTVEDIPPPEPAMEALRPLIAAYFAASSAG